VDKDLEELLKKFEAANAISKDQLALLTALAEKTPAVAAAIRKIPFVDESPTGKVRSIDRILAIASNPFSATKAINLVNRMPEWPLTDEEKTLRGVLDDALLTATLLGKNPRALKMWGYSFDGTALGKALAEATATAGAEWVPTLLSADFIEKFRLASKVAQLFPEVPMPSNPFDLPFLGGELTWYLVPESTSDEPSKAPASTVTTGKRTLTEDSILAVLPLLKEELNVSGGEAIEDVLINGDLTATHMDSDVTSALDRRKAWNGLRRLAITAATARVDTGTFSATTAISIRTKMGKYGVTPSDCAYIVSLSAYAKMLAFTEVMTVDKYGPLATIVTGELARLSGSPILISERVRQDLNATGYYDGTTMTKTEILTAFRRGFVIGTRGLPKVKFRGSDQDPDSDQNVLSVSFRKAFLDRWAVSATVVPCGMGYNITTA
jgi:hypothetical protein